MMEYCTLILILFLFIASSLASRRKIGRRNLEEITHPPAINNNATIRTAICLSGQMRSANLSWTSGYIHENAAFRMFGPDDPPTTAQTIIEWLFKPLSQEGGLDVFMYIQVPPTNNNSNWDGDAFSFVPQVGDLTGCKLFSDNEVFRNTGNHFYCLIDAEVQLMTTDLRNFSMWQKRHPGYQNEKMNEQALQQYYGMYRANLASKQHAVANGIVYSHKIRLRPDTPFVKPFPGIASLNFGPRGTKETDCKSTIYWCSRWIGGYNDWFNVGLTADMDHLLDRYVDFTSTYFDFVSNNGRKWWWDLEDHFEALMRGKYNICLESGPDIWMVVIRRKGHSNEAVIPPVENQWVDISLN